MPALRMAGMRVAYIHAHTTSDQTISARAGVSSDCQALASLAIDGPGQEDIGFRLRRGCQAVFDDGAQSSTLSARNVTRTAPMPSPTVGAHPGLGRARALRAARSAWARRGSLHCRRR